MKSTGSTMIRTCRIAAAGAAISLCAWTPLIAQSPSCAQIYGVMSRTFDRPFHLYMIDSAQTDMRLHGGKPSVSEEVWVGNVMYVKVRGTWHKSPIDIAELRKSQKEKYNSDAKATCTHVRDETINGESTAMWAIHSVTEYGTNDSNAWISKSRHLIVQADERLDVGGALGKSHMVQRYDYANVQAPAGVR